MGLDSQLSDHIEHNTVLSGRMHPNKLEISLFEKNVYAKKRVRMLASVELIRAFKLGKSLELTSVMSAIT